MLCGMKTWKVDEFGHYKDKLRWADAPPPKPSGGELLVRVDGAGVNFPDILMIAGGYQVKPPLPFTPGVEVAGEVLEAGAGTRFKKGDRVISMTIFGGFAEQAICPDAASFRLPEGMPIEEAAAFQMTYQTSYFGLVHRGQLKKGEFLLVHAGASGVGTAAIQIGKAVGATVIATAGSDDKLKVCKDCGADHVINYTTDNFADAVRQITDGHGADVIYDPVGGDVFDQSAKCIAWEGRLLVIGFAGGRIPTIAANRILLKNFSVVGLHWGPYRMHNGALVDSTQEELYSLYAAKKIKPVVCATYKLSELPKALEMLESRKAYGKVVLKP